MRSRVLTALELVVLLCWTLLVTWPYLNFDMLVVPAGREFLHHIHPHHVWNNALECGWCAVWNGNVRGGYPAFADPQTSLLHPLIILATLGAGVLNGAKLSLVGAFLMAGLAQWWLGRVLGLGRVACVWSAAVAVAGGQLAGRMEHGIFSLVIAVAACALVLPPLIRLMQTGSRRYAVLLGITLALAVLAGQGYIQIGLLLTMPAALLLVRWEKDFVLLLTRRLLLAAAVALLLAAPLLVPLLHFLPNFTKFTDSNFSSAQPFAFIPLNLVINDHAFYSSEALGKTPFPGITVIFIGWIPVLLALWGLRDLWHSPRRRLMLFLVATALLAFWYASAAPFRLIVSLLPALEPQIGGLRFPALFAILAVPPVLALAAAGLQHILDMDWPRLQMGLVDSNSQHKFTLHLRWLLVLPLALALSTAWTFTSHWVKGTAMHPDIFAVLDALRTPDTQWVNTPYGEQFWIEPAVRSGLKLSQGVQGWFWYGRDIPEPVREASPGGSPPGMAFSSVVGNKTISEQLEGREYATVQHPNDSHAACEAHATGGNIDVQCQITEPGTLTVKENSWAGWQVYVNDAPADLIAGPWLKVELPEGTNWVEFRYRPWDVQIGLLLWLGGVLLACYAWWQGDEPDTADAEAAQTSQQREASEDKPLQADYSI